MRAARAVRPAMIRGILQVIVVLFVLRIFFWFMRLISAGMREGDAEGRAREAAARRRANPYGSSVPAKRAIRVDRSNVTDVPFTEIEARPGSEDGSGARADSAASGAEPVERAEAR